MRNGSFYETVGVLLLAGQGKRFRHQLPKQFLPYQGKPLFLTPARALDESSLSFLLFVVPENHFSLAEKAIEEAGFRTPYSIITGGKTRQDSVHNALTFLKQLVNDNTLVLIHDAARPFVSVSLVEETLKAARKQGASVTACPATDAVAITKIPGLVDGYLPREEVMLVQTPQAFKYSLLENAFSSLKEDEPPFRDEGSLVLRKTGVAPLIVTSYRRNLKITDYEDEDFLKLKDKTHE